MFNICFIKSFKIMFIKLYKYNIKTNMFQKCVGSFNKIIIMWTKYLNKEKRLTCF